MRDQEIVFGQINYWEGPIKAAVKVNGGKVKGKGFMELVGYPSDYNYLLLVGKDVEERFLERIKNIFKIH